LDIRRPESSSDSPQLNQHEAGLEHQDAGELELSFQQVRYALRREGLWEEREHVDRVAHRTLSGLGTEAVAQKTGLTVRRVRDALWLASGEWARLRAARE
jgi:hypothetical protein